MWLRRRTPGWDALASASAELGLLFVTITLVTGSLWGRVTWGTYWTWDARLTSTALLAVMLVGYLALRRVELAPGGSTRAAVLGLLLLPNVLIVNRSVEWWRSLHQEATITKLDPSIDGEMLVAFAVGMVAGLLVFAWLLVHRFRLAWLEQQVERHDLDAAVAARRAEAASAAAPSTGDAAEVTA
jgi:heme exporter protein C